MLSVKGKTLRVGLEVKTVTHLGRGLFVNGVDAARLHDELCAGETQIGHVAKEIIAMIWPSSTALTFFAPGAMACAKSPFHTGRMDLAQSELIFRFVFCFTLPNFVDLPICVLFHDLQFCTFKY